MRFNFFLDRLLGYYERRGTEQFTVVDLPDKKVRDIRPTNYPEPPIL